MVRSKGKGKELVNMFLRTMEARDLNTARTFLAPGFMMVFPGDKRMDSLEEMVDWSRTRYRNVTKTFEDFDEFERGDRTIVYCFGLLNGLALDGRRIQNVRFIDRFVIKDDKLIEQKVWNDLSDFLN